MCSARNQPDLARRVISYLLAIALVHQLGACPCGCLEGNLWVQTFLRLTRRAPELFASKPSRPVQAIDSRACDGNHAHVAYVSSDGPSLTHAFGAIVAVWAVAPDKYDVAGAHRFLPQRAREDAWPVSGPSARTLRAQLQIFLI